MVVTEHLRRDLMERKHLTWTDLRVVEFNAAAEEQLMHLFNLLAGAKDTFVAPEMLEIVAADPLGCSLVSIGHCCLETVLFG